MDGKMNGAVLASDEIKARLDRGELFLPGSWDERNIRSAAYDMRIADDFLVVPDPDSGIGRRYKRGDRLTDPFILLPGDVAFVSTKERLCVPWDLAGNIGIKFGYARKGVLVLTGLLVDPGFGLTRDQKSDWIAKKDERLHFLLANVGHDRLVVIPGKQIIASIQFIRVDGNPDKIEVPSTTDMEKEFFDERHDPKGGLIFFKDMADLRTRTEEFKTRISAMEKGSNQIVLFGVYLLSATAIVAFLTVFFSLISSENFMSSFKNLSSTLSSISFPAAIIIGVTIFSIAWLVRHSLKLFASLFAKKEKTY